MILLEEGETRPVLKANKKIKTKKSSIETA